MTAASPAHCEALRGLLDEVEVVSLRRRRRNANADARRDKVRAETRGELVEVMERARAAGASTREVARSAKLHHSTVQELIGGKS